MGSKVEFDVERTLREHFNRQQKKEEFLMSGIPAPVQSQIELMPLQCRKRSARLGEAWGEAVAGLIMVACLAIALAAPLRSPLLELGLKAYANGNRNGTFQTLSQRAVDIALHTGRAFSQ